MSNLANPAKSGKPAAFAKISALDDRVSGWVIGVTRMVVGVLWLANLEWKRPSDFGLDLKNGLYKYIDSAVRLPVWKPYAWFTENVVLENYRFFGWITLIMEMVLAALLIVGFKTRWVALLGAGLSVSIALSVLNYDKAYEWPWSYYLMFAIHMILWATNAGLHLGVDGALRNGRAGAVATWRAIGVLAVVCGAVGWLVARDGDFFAKQGQKVAWKYETNVLWFNQFSALLTVALGLMLIVGALTKAKVLIAIPGVVSALLVVQVLVQWRYNKGQWTGGLTGATGATAGFWLAMAVAVLATFLRAQRSVE
jgi:thiosulfate dehydrogenase (quinone) large subunit